MTQHDDMLYVALMRDEIREAIDTVGESSCEELMADHTDPHVVAYHLMRLATRPLKASEAFRAAHPEIPWQDLSEMHDRVEDEHFSADPAAMWQIVTSELPAIVERLEALLPKDPLWRYRDEESQASDAASPHDSEAGVVDPAAEERFNAILGLQREAFIELCDEYDVRSIRLFGSALREDFGPDSDVDMMVEFGPGAPTGWKVFAFDDEVSALIGRKADAMHGQPVRYIREQIIAEARTVYIADGERRAKEVGEP